MDKTMDRSDYDKHINYYNNYNVQNRRRNANFSKNASREEEFDTLSNKKTYREKKNIQMENTKENNKDIEHSLDSDNISSTSKQKSDDTSFTTKENNKYTDHSLDNDNISEESKKKYCDTSSTIKEDNKCILGSLDPFSALEKLLSISAKTKKKVQ